MIQCDECGTMVNVESGEFGHNAELDITFFTCNMCIRQEESIYSEYEDDIDWEGE